MEMIWHICQAIGVGAAAGLSPAVGLAFVIVCAAFGLGITNANDSYDFLESAVAIVIALFVLLQSLALIAIPGGMAARVSADRPRLTLIHMIVAVLLGALAGGIIFGSENDPTWIGMLFGGLSAALVAYASGKLLRGVGERLEAGEQRQLKKASKEEAKAAKQDTEASRRVIAFAVDIVTIIAVILPLFVPFTGLVLPLVAIVLIWRGRRRKDEKHEGLRVLS